MIKSIITLASLLIISTLLLGQELPKEKSSEHILIKGTNIYMIPPPNYSLSSNFKGFQNPEDQTSMIMVMEIPGPYTQVTKGFNSEAMKTQGMDFISKKEIMVDSMEGIHIVMDQSANGLVYSKHLLIYGNENSTTLINGVYLKDSIQLGTKIEKSLFTTYVDSNKSSDPRESLDYTINENVGSLKFLYVMGNAMLFNRDLKTPTESEDKATLIVDKSFAKVKITDKKKFCIDRFKRDPEEYAIPLSSEVTEISIDNLDGYEFLTQSTVNENEKIYQALLFQEDGGYFVFLATYFAEGDQAMNDIKKIVNTFQRK